MEQFATLLGELTLFYEEQDEQAGAACLAPKSLFGGSAFVANLPARQRSLAGRNGRLGVLTKAFLSLIAALRGEKMAK